MISLEPIPPERRISERELRSRFEQDRSAILGALLDMMAYGLRVLPTVKIRELPRMADFVIWATACERAAWKDETFAKALQVNRAETVEAVVDADPVAGAVLELMMRTIRTMRTMRTQVQTNGSASIEWKGTATDLLRELTAIASVTMLRDAKWPKTAIALSNRLIRAVPALREQGVFVARAREGNDRSRMIRIHLDNADANQSPSSALSASSAQFDGRHDDEDADLVCEEAEAIDPAEFYREEFVGTESTSPPSFKEQNTASEDLPRPSGILIKRPKKAS